MFVLFRTFMFALLCLYNATLYKKRKSKVLESTDDTCITRKYDFKDRGMGCV